MLTTELPVSTSVPTCTIGEGHEVNRCPGHGETEPGPHSGLSWAAPALLFSSTLSPKRCCPCKWAPSRDCPAPPLNPGAGALLTPHTEEDGGGFSPGDSPGRKQLLRPHTGPCSGDSARAERTQLLSPHQGAQTSNPRPHSFSESSSWSSQVGTTGQSHSDPSWSQAQQSLCPKALRAQLISAAHHIPVDTHNRGPSLSACFPCSLKLHHPQQTVGSPDGMRQRSM